MNCWQLDPLDTLFFRGSEPFNAGETAFLESLFPPSPETVQGLVRTAILSRHAQSLNEYVGGRNGLSKHGLDLFAEIGEPRNGGTGRLRLQGPLPAVGGSPLFPVPLDVVALGEALQFLRPGPAVECDMGQVRLPTTTGAGVEVLEGRWASASQLSELLVEVAPTSKFWSTSVPSGFLRKTRDGAAARRALALHQPEPRVGIEQDTAMRTAIDGHLYSIAPLRFNNGVSLVIGVGGIDASLQVQPGSPEVLRFGGEGRLASISRTGAWTLPPCPSAPTASDGSTRFRIVFATPARFGDDSLASWHPAGFAPSLAAEGTQWRGAVDGLPFAIVSTCVGKPLRLGGWDLRSNRPKPLMASVPAGSVYFCETEATWSEVCRLHGRCIGNGSEIGFGLILIGRWT